MAIKLLSPATFLMTALCSNTSNRMKPAPWNPFHIRHLNQFWWEEASLFTAVQWKQNSSLQASYSLDVPVNHISAASACCSAHHVTIWLLGFQTQNCWKWRDFPKITLNYISYIPQRWTELSREMQTQIQFYMHLLKKNPLKKKLLWFFFILFWSKI